MVDILYLPRTKQQSTNGDNQYYFGSIDMLRCQHLYNNIFYEIYLVSKLTSLISIDVDRAVVWENSNNMRKTPMKRVLAGNNTYQCSICGYRHVSRDQHWSRSWHQHSAAWQYRQWEWLVVSHYTSQGTVLFSPNIHKAVLIRAGNERSRRLKFKNLC